MARLKDCLLLDILRTPLVGGSKNNQQLQFFLQNVRENVTPIRCKEKFILLGISWKNI